MRTYEPDRVVKVLSGLATGLYYVTWVAAVLVLAGMPLARYVGAGHADALYRLSAPVIVHPPLNLTEHWRVRGARVVVSQVRATAEVPMDAVPTSMAVLAWVALAVSAALAVLFLHHLRRLFQRVRQGAPFDPANAIRLRWLGIVLLVGVVWVGVSNLWMSLAVSRMLEGPGNELGTGIQLNIPAILVALVLIALAEIFRRGAALEEEQALVV